MAYVPVYRFSGIKCRAALSSSDCSTSISSTTSLIAYWIVSWRMVFRLLPPWTLLYLWTRALTQHQVVMVGHVAQAVQGPAHVDVGGRVILVKIVVRRSLLV